MENSWRHRPPSCQIWMRLRRRCWSSGFSPFPCVPHKMQRTGGVDLHAGLHGAEVGLAGGVEDLAGVGALADAVVLGQPWAGADDLAAGSRFARFSVRVFRLALLGAMAGTPRIWPDPRDFGWIPGLRTLAPVSAVWLDGSADGALGDFQAAVQRLHWPVCKAVTTREVRQAACLWVRIHRLARLQRYAKRCGQAAGVTGCRRQR